MPQPEKIFTIADISLIPALEAYASFQMIQRDKGQHAVLTKVMRFWVDFARAKVTPKSQAPAIRAKLMTLVSQYTRSKRRFKGKRANEYRGTLAAAIVAFLNYKGARSASRARSASFYGTVQKFVNARAFSANMHRAGFEPARRQLRGKPDSVPGPRNYRHPLGRMDEVLNDKIASILVENYAVASPVPGRPAPLGIAGLRPGAFTDALPQVIRQFSDFLAQDMEDMARKAGFEIKE